MNSTTFASIDSVFSGNSKPLPIKAVDVLSGIHGATIHNQEDLDALRVVKMITGIVGKQLEAKISVVEVEGGEFAVLAHPEYRKTQYVEEVSKEVVKRFGKKTRVQVVTIAPIVLLSLLQTTEERGDKKKTESTNYEQAFASVIQFALNNNASDVTFNVNNDSPESQIHFQIDGMYVAPALWRMPTARMVEILDIIWQKVKGGSASVFSHTDEHQGKVLVTVGEKQILLRWMSLASDKGVSLTLRALEQGAIRSLEESGYLPSQISMFHRNQASGSGIICLAGRVGSGKTRTTAALLDRLPRTWKIIAIEDPVEIEQDHIIQCTVEKKIDGSSDQAYVSKLHSLKRSAPNAISLGEIRDELTGGGCIEVGGMGTQLYVTVHATGAVQVPERFASKSIRIPRDFLAMPGMLKLAVYQALVHKLCSCALPLSSLLKTGGPDATGIVRPSGYWEQYEWRLAKMFSADVSRLRVRNVDGCELCRNEHYSDLNGYKGRTTISEMLEPNSHYELLRMIRDGDTLGMQEFVNTLPRTAIDDPNMDNKNIVECGMYKALQGQLDPRDIELATESFETLALQPRYAGEK
jgi:type II secretory ATPase GspE/PulE/Tfp pilus assembly ATPase PilB-like protein